MGILNNRGAMRKLSPFDHGNKLLHHPEHLSSVLRGERPFPLQLEIDLTNRCNHSCSFCNMADTLKSDNSILDFHILQARLEEAYSLGSRAISFSGGGEPLTHPQFSQIITFASNIGYDIGIVTNGALINKEKTKSISNSVDWIRFSIGGPTHESYAKIQGKNDLSKVLSNVKNLSSYNSSDSNTLDIGLKLLIDKPTFLDLPKFANILSSHSISSEEVSYVQLVPNQYLEDPGVFINDTQTVNAINHLKINLEQLSIPLLGSYFSVDPADRDLHYSQKCFAHFYQMVIKADGDVSFCKNCRETSALTVGNINADSMLDIWNSNYIAELESTIKPSNCNTFCRSLKLNDLIQSIKSPPATYSKNFF